MANDLILKGAAFAVFALLFGGSAYGTFQYLDTGELEPRGLVLEAATGREYSVAAGSDLSLPFVVRNFGPLNESVRVRVLATDGVTSAGELTLDVPPGGGSGGFLNVTVPDDLGAGKHRVTVAADTLLAPYRRVTTTLTFDVLAAGAGVAEGETARIEFVAYTADGRMFAANVQSLARAPIPSLPGFQPSGDLVVNTTAGSPISREFPGLVAGVLGMRVGETRTVMIPPELGFRESFPDTHPAVTRLPVEYRIPREASVLSMERFQRVLNQSSGGLAADYDVGDTFVVVDGANRWTHRVTERTEASVSALPEPAPGDRFTLSPPYPPTWKNASVVKEVTDKEIVFETAAPTAAGERFTFFDYWPNASTVEGIQDGGIVIRHDPAPGIAFEATDREGNPHAYTVVNVTGDVVNLAQKSESPLAGQTVYFNVRLIEVVAEKRA